MYISLFGFILSGCEDRDLDFTYEGVEDVFFSGSLE